MMQRKSGAWRIHERRKSRAGRDPQGELQLLEKTGGGGQRAAQVLEVHREAQLQECPRIHVRDCDLQPLAGAPASDVELPSVTATQALDAAKQSLAHERW